MFARLIYSVLLTAVAPLVWLWLWLRQRKSNDQWELFAAQRFGRYPQPWDGPAPVWVHAVSVGEVRASIPLIQALLLQGERVLMTHMTPTGRAEAKRLLAQEIGEGVVRQQWVPYDFYSAMRGLIKHFEPKAIILIEREVWPNLIHAAVVNRVPVILASARFSERSAKHNRWVNCLFAGLMQQTYGALKIVLAQTQEDAQRLFDAGAQNVSVCGNLKFDVHLPEVAVQGGHAWRDRIGRPIVVIASTREGEDALFVPLLKNLCRQDLSAQGGHALVILVPRHSQRFDQAASLLDGAGLRYARWSMLRDDPTGIDVVKGLEIVLGDTMGELPFFYGAANIAIVGGSFEAHGGQNFIEASATAVPVIVGPHTRNFKDAVKSAAQAHALVQVNDAQAAVKQAQQWLTDSEEAERVGVAGKAWVSMHVGATARIMDSLRASEGGLQKS